MTTGRDTDSYTLLLQDHDTRDFYTYCNFCILQTIYKDLMKVKNMTDYGK